jgi:hypothetical protein
MPWIRPLRVSVPQRTGVGASRRRAVPVGHAIWKRISLWLHVVDCPVLADYDQRAEPWRSPGVGESAL